MIGHLALLLLSLGAILAACELFTNAVEWAGKRMGLGTAAVGSVLAAVGTAMPETLIPLVAIFLGGGQAGKEIGVGAIMGAPFMLGTLAYCVTGVAVWGFSRSGRRGMTIAANATILRQDILYFLGVYLCAVGMTFVSWRGARVVAALGLVAAYVVYVYKHLQHPEELEGEVGPLTFDRHAPTPRGRLIAVQLLVSLGGIIGGADLFVHHLEALSRMWGVPALLLSMVIAPLATELPEKFNSVIWVRQGKDTLALGNISGAMVFQSAIPMSVGILFTPWVLDRAALLGAVLTVGSTMFIAWNLLQKGRVSVPALVAGGGFYAVFLIYFFTRLS